MAENYILKIQSESNTQSNVYYEVNLAFPPIGEGGMGRVFRGVQVNNTTGVRRDVAIKFLKEDLPASMIERSRREASIRIHHDNLVEMIDFVEMSQTDVYGKTMQRVHVVSELLDGVLLADLLQGKLTNSDEKIVPYAKQMYDLYIADRKKFVFDISKKITSAIMALHDAGYIHRDIDPSNIMVTADEKVKVIDFGIARSINQLKQERSHTSIGTFLGKAEYAAPELIEGDLRHQNATTDIYAIGILIFHLLTGHLPFEGPRHEVLEMQLHAELPLHEIEDPKLRSVIEKATQKKQSLRYQSAAEFRVAVEQAQTGLSVSPSKKGQVESGIEPYFNPYGTQIIEKQESTDHIEGHECEKSTTDALAFLQEIPKKHLAISVVSGLIVGGILALII